MASDKKDIIEIVVTTRNDDYHACIKGHPEIWGCGENYDMAIGSLIISHKDEFGIKVDFDRPKKRYGFYIVTCVNCGFKKFVAVFPCLDMMIRLGKTSKCCKTPNYSEI